MGSQEPIWAEASALNDSPQISKYFPKFFHTPIFSRYRTHSANYTYKRNNTMNDLYNQTETIRGRLYRYDPDQDCWYPTDRYKDMTPLEAWSPLIVLALLCAVAMYLEYFQ